MGITQAIRRTWACHDGLPALRLFPQSHPRRTRFFSTASYDMASQSNKPVVLYTVGTPNGVVVSILLEELKVCIAVRTRGWLV